MPKSIYTLGVASDLTKFRDMRFGVEGLGLRVGVVGFRFGA